MVTYNDKILVPNSTKDGLDTIHPETNTGNVYDFKNSKWLDAVVEEISSNLTTHINKLASTTELGHVKVDGTTIKVDSVTGIATVPLPNLSLESSTRITLNANWSHGSEFYQPLTYYKDSFGIVHIQGRATRNIGGGFTPGFLPNGYRPASRTNIIGLIDGNISTIAFEFDGSILVTVPIGGYFEVSGSFRTT